VSENSNKTDRRRKGGKKKRSKGSLMEQALRKEALTFEDLRKVLAACETIEEQAMIEVAVTTGIRREDFARIELMNVDLEGRTITFWEEKKDRPWKVPLEPPVVQTLKKYILTIPEGSKHLFPMSGRTYYRRFNEILERAGLPNMRFHDLRRSCMRLSRAMGRDIRFVMDLTGDTAETVLQEYEGYSVDEMNDLLEREGILYHTLNRGDLQQRKRKLQEEIEKIDDILDQEDLFGVIR
jgi:integrase